MVDGEPPHFDKSPLEAMTNIRTDKPPHFRYPVSLEDNRYNCYYYCFGFYNNRLSSNQFEK